MADFPETVYWLALLQESGLRLNLLKPIVLRWCLTENRPLSELFQLTSLDLSATFGLPDADADRLLGVPKKLKIQAALLEKWKKEGIEPIIRTDSRYPRRLAFHLAPAMQPLVLWAQGNTPLLNQPGVTMLGQAGSSQPATEFVDQLIAVLEEEQVGLVSGYARGLDRTTFEMMLATPHGFTVALLPMGLSAFAKTTNKLLSAVYGGRTVLVSPFAPDTPFDDKLAEARNLLIDHLALALLILESDDDAQARAVAAINRGLPVFVRQDTAANRELLGSGALLLTDPGEVIDWVQQALVDDAIQESEDESELESMPAPPLNVAPAAPPPAPDDDFSLRTDDVPPLDSDEALNLLGLGGDVPEVLRRKLEKRKSEE